MKVMSFLFFFACYVFVPISNIAIQAHIDEFHGHQVHKDTYVDSHHHSHDDHNHQLKELNELEEGYLDNFKLRLKVPVEKNTVENLNLKIATDFKTNKNFYKFKILDHPPDQFRNLPLLN
jgi:hypothetical protein